MIYEKPKDVTFTQMAMWIDENVYNPACDDERLYEYIWHLSVMLSYKCGFPYTDDEQDSFGLYCASRLYFRYRNKKQFELNDDGTTKLEKIKSVLNYLKKVLHHYKTDYELEFHIENKNLDVISTDYFNLDNYLVDNTSLFDRMSFSYTLGSVSTVCKAHLRKIPYKKDSSEWMNIYLSCLLTLLNSITVSNRKLRELKQPLSETSDNILNRLYADLRKEPPVLFHTDEKLSNYIIVLVNEIRHVLASELSWQMHSYVSADSVVKDILCNSGA